MCLRFRNGACDAIKSAAVPRSKYPWGALRLSPCLCVLRCQGSGSAYDFLRSLRTSAHTGVAIRIPHSTHISVAERLGERIATPDDVGHWLAMTVENQTLRNHPTSDHKLGRLFFQCQRFRRSWSSTIESVEAVRSTPRTGLNRVNCTRRARRKSPWGKFVGRPHVSPPSPRIKARFQRAALGQGPRQSPTKWVWWGEEEQWND